MSDAKLKAVLRGAYHRHKKKGFYPICPEWSKDINSFCKWAYENGYEKGKYLLRKDIDLPYSPENCYFDVIAINPAVGKANETRHDFFGNTLNFRKLCKAYGILEDTVYQRMKRGLDFNRAILYPTWYTNAKVFFVGETSNKILTVPPEYGKFKTFASVEDAYKYVEERYNAGFIEKLH